MRPSPIWFFPTLSRLVLDVLPIVAAGAITVYLLVSLAARPGVSAADKGTDGISVELPASAELSGDALTAMVWADQRIAPARPRQTAQPAPDASAPSQAKAVPAATLPAVTAPAQSAPANATPANVTPANATPTRQPQRTAAPVERRNPPTQQPAPPKTQQTAQPSRTQQTAQPQIAQPPRTLAVPPPAVTAVVPPPPAPMPARAPAPIEPPMPIPAAAPPAEEQPPGMGTRIARTATGWGGKAVDAVVSVPVAAYNVGRKTVDAVADAIRP